LASAATPRPGQIWVWSARYHFVPQGVTVCPGQVSLFALLSLPIIPPPTTPCRLEGLVWFLLRAYRESRPQKQTVLPLSRVGASLGLRHYIVGSPRQTAESSSRWLETFQLLLRTNRSPPVAFHPASRRRSYVWLQGPNPTLTGTYTLPVQQHHRRTMPRPCAVEVHVRFYKTAPTTPG
jgi:hypothetical protein